MAMGHRVVDEWREVEQYGRRGRLRYISLDFMVSNGYTSWFWDGRARTGGWAESPKIVQVRRAYVNGGVRAWRMVTDPLERAKTEKDIARLTAADDAVARMTPHAYLPGLALRVRLGVFDHLLRSLDAQGIEGAALRNAFIAEVDRRNGPCKGIATSAISWS